STSGTKRKSDVGLPPAAKKERNRSKSPAASGGDFKKSPVVISPLKSKVGFQEQYFVLCLFFVFNFLQHLFKDILLSKTCMTTIHVWKTAQKVQNFITYLKIVQS